MVQGLGKYLTPETYQEAPTNHWPAAPLPPAETRYHIFASVRDELSCIAVTIIIGAILGL